MEEMAATGKGSAGEEVVLDFLAKELIVQLLRSRTPHIRAFGAGNGVISIMHLTGASARRGLCHRWIACSHIVSLPVDNVLHCKPSFLIFI